MSSINATWLMALGGLTSCLLRPGRYVGGLALLLAVVSRHRELVTLIAMGGLVTVRILLANSYFPDVSALNVVGLAKYLGTLWPLRGIGWLLLGIRRQNWLPAT